MQEEVKKHTKKIYKAMKNPKHTFVEKIKDVTIEILIIVFAVTLSIWLHSWSEHRHQQKEVSFFLNNLKNDLQNDIKIIDTEKEDYARVNLVYEKFLRLTSLQIDSIQQSNSIEQSNSIYNLPFHSKSRKISIGNYEGFKSSGKLGYIKDEKLKQKILHYYQRVVPVIDEVDKIYNDFMFKCFDIMIENGATSEEKLFSDPKFKSSIFFLVKIGKNNIRVYHEIGKTDAIELIKAIEKEMNK